MFTAKYVGHACVLLNFGGTKILTDPWFGHPWFASGEIAYPPITPLSDKELSEIDAIQISHLHPDHYCTKTLALIGKDVDVVIGKYPSPAFKERIEKLGFKKVIEIGESPVTYKNLEIGIFLPAVFDYSFDSLPVFKFEEKSYIFNNDCILTLEKYKHIKKIFGVFDVGFLGYTVVNPYPSCYQLASSSKETELTKSQAQSFKTVEDIDDILQFNKIVPYANGLRLFNEQDLHHNQTFNNPVDLQKSFSKKDKIQILEPNDIYDPTVASKKELKFSYTPAQINAFIKSQNYQLHYEFIHEGLLEKTNYESFFDQYLTAASGKWKIDMGIHLNIFHRDKVLTLTYVFKNKTLSRSPLAAKPELVISYRAEWLNEVMHKKISMLALYFNFHFHVKINDLTLRNQYYVHGW